MAITTPEGEYKVISLLRFELIPLLTLKQWLSHSKMGKYYLMYFIPVIQKNLYKQHKR